MECPNCHFVATPGQSAVEGTCPNCERPYRDQPVPLNSDMEMRNMPEPGMEDSGGNPLQEGILGDWQNRGVRDESYASVKKAMTGDEEGYDGWANWETWNTKLMLDNEYEHYLEMQKMAERNAHPDEIRDYAIPAVIGPSNQTSIEGAKSWNDIPEHDRLDPHYEDLKNRNPDAADLVNNLGFGPDVSDEEPNIIDPNKVDWDAIKRNMMSELPDDHPAYQEYKEEQEGPTTLPKHWGTTEPDFEVTDVIVPDPESILPDNNQMEKKADLLGDIGDVAAPVAGGTAGFLIGGPAGAAIGAGLAGGGMEALQGGDVGDVATTGLTDAALGGIGGAGGAALKAGSLGEAAASGSTRGGIGSLMKSAWSKVPTDKIKNAYLMHSVMNDAGNAAQPMTQPTPGMVQPGAQQMSPSFYSAVDTPTSHGEIPSNNTEDPEQVDFHEKNDGEKDGLQSDIGVNDIGGTDLGPDDFFSPDSGALASFAELLPKILQFALGDQSAAGDPDMEELHQKLEAEKPGYMNSADDDHGSKVVMMIMKGNPNDEGDGDSALQDNDTPHDPISEHEASALRPGLETTCDTCGGVMDASVSRCPQCGKENGRHLPQPTNPDFSTPQEMMNPPMEATAAGAMTQGPNTDEQKAQVAEVLQAEGRAEEIPAMIMEPWNYADELSKITGQEEPPQDIGQPGPPPPMPPGGQEGSMPMPGMAPSGPQSGPSMMAAVKKYAATVDGFCEACPNCGSHSTGYLDYEEGKAGCKTCGKTFDAPKMVEHKAADGDLSAAPVAPELSQAQPEEQEESGSLGWVDESGSPLKVGQTYDMYSNNYDIPDRITIDAVKPDVIEFTLVGEYGLSHRTELTHEESSVEGTTFVPTEGAEEFDQAPEEAGQGAQPAPAPGDQTDLSTPHEMMASRTANPVGPTASIRTNSHDIGLTEDKATYNPEVEAFFADDPAPAPQGHEASVGSVNGGEATGPAWLMEGVPLSTHMSGAHMSPWEQRGYIDEVGDARNADKLQLSGTHYEMDDIADSFLFGL